MQAVLKYGNLLNTGSNALSNCKAFSIDILPRLFDLKSSVKPTKSLIYFIIKDLMAVHNLSSFLDVQPLLLDEDAAVLRKATKINLDDLRKLFRGIH